MQVLRKVVARSGVRSVINLSKPLAPQFVRFSSIIVEKEKGDEARYFRNQEVDRQKTVRANMERILAQDDESEEKKELMTKLGNMNF
jgi:hypothetical protein